MSQFCVMAEKCTVFDRHTDMPGLAYTALLCNGCRFRGESEINSLRYDYLDLSQLIPPSDGRNNEAQIFRPKPESSPPINQQVWHLREQIAHYVLLAERVLRMHLNAPDDRMGPVREGYAVNNALRFLFPRVDKIAEISFPLEYNEDFGPDSGDVLTGARMLWTLGAMHRSARRLLGLDARTISVPGECPSCGVSSLRRKEDEPQRVWCARPVCSVLMSGDEYLAAQRMIFTRPRDRE